MNINKPFSFEATKEIQARTLQLLRTIGYFIFVFALLNYLDILIPLQLFNPLWEFSVVGGLVEQVWVPLLGFFLVFFYLKDDQVSFKQARLLNFLSYIALLLSIFYFALFPLVLVDTYKLNSQLTSANRVKIANFDTGLENARKLIASATTPEQLFSLSKRFNLGDEDILRSRNSFEHMKEQITQKLENDQTKYHKLNASEHRTQMLGFYKKATKYILGTLLSSACMYMIFRITKWSRAAYKIYKNQIDPLK